MFEQVTVQRQRYGTGEDLLVCGNAAGDLPQLAPLKGKVQCVYLDPPFRTGEKFERRRPFGTQGWKNGTPAPGYKAFDDRITEKNWTRMLKKLTAASWELLQDTGVFCLHLDWRMNAQARIICDRVFGKSNFLNEIIWAYESGGRSKKTFSRKHDVILLYAKSRKYKFDLTRVPLDRGMVRHNHMKRNVDENGKLYSSIVSHGKEYRYYDDEPVYPGDVWTDINHLQQKDPERTGYATQKPMKLLERLLLPVTEPGDLVVDLCCGSGTAAAVAEQLDCRFAAVDISPEAIAVSLSRMKKKNVTVECATSSAAAELTGRYDGETGRLILEDLLTEHPSFPKRIGPGDRLESWELGRIEDGTFIAEQCFGRSSRYPELTLDIRLPDPEGKAILTTDAAGMRRAYVLRK